MSGPELIVGLGNPGAKYQQTRHNAGFWFIDELARRYSASLKLETKFFGEAVKCSIEGQTVWLLKPNTFMNLSGRSVSALANYYKISPERILVVHDELDFSPGTVRFKRGGGHGGHNGLRDIASALGNKEFLRLRLGVGHPGNSKDVIDYVLRVASISDTRAIADAIDKSMTQMNTIMVGDYERTMTALHSNEDQAKGPR